MGHHARWRLGCLCGEDCVALRAAGSVMTRAHFLDPELVRRWLIVLRIALARKAVLRVSRCRRSLLRRCSQRRRRERRDSQRRKDGPSSSASICVLRVSALDQFLPARSHEPPILWRGLATAPGLCGIPLTSQHHSHDVARGTLPAEVKGQDAVFEVAVAGLGFELFGGLNNGVKPLL